MPAEYEDAKGALAAAVFAAFQKFPDQAPLYRVTRIAESFYAGRFAEALSKLAALK